LSEYKRQTLLAGAVGVIIVLALGLGLYYLPIPKATIANNVSVSTSTQTSTSPTFTVSSTISTSTWATTILTTSSSSSTSTPSYPVFLPNSTLAVPQNPVATIYDPGNNVILVLSVCCFTDPGGSISYLTVFNATTNALIESEPFGGRNTMSPETMAYDSASNEVYVSNNPNGNTNVLVLNSNYEVVKTISLANGTGGEPYMAYDPANGEMYLSLDQDVLAVNQNNRIVANLTIDNVSGLGYDPPLEEICVSSEGNATGYHAGVYLVNSSNAIAGVANIGFPYQMIYDPATQLMYVSNLQGGMTGFDATTVEYVSNFSNFVDAFAYNPSNQDLYALLSPPISLNSSTWELAVISNSSALVTTIQISASYQMIFDSHRDWVMLSGGNVTIINTGNAISGTIDTSGFSSPAVYDPTSGCAYFVLPNNNSVSVFC
jgi:hypothetical protein